MYIRGYRLRRSKSLCLQCKALENVYEPMCSIVIVNRVENKDKPTENSPTRLSHSKSWAMYDSATPYQSI